MSCKYATTSVLTTLLFCNIVFPQTPKKQTTETTETQRSQPPKDSQIEDTASRHDAQRAHAIQTISSLADEARNYKDEPLRAKVQAQAANALWDADQPRARFLFQRAWETAELVDKEGRQRFLTAKRAGPGFIPPPPNVRGQVLQLAAIRDRSLADSFLASIEKEESQRRDEETKSNKWDATATPEAITKRLQLATALLESGDTERATLIAKPALTRVTEHSVIFLALLRQKTSATADKFFNSLLDRTATDPNADATSVSLLSTYVLTPSLIVTMTRNGTSMHSLGNSTLPPPTLSPALRSKFFSVASEILIRATTPEDLELTSAGLAGTIFTIQRLLPIFQQYAPTIASSLQGQLSTLTQGRDHALTEQQRRFMNAGLTPTEKATDELDDLLATIERTPDANTRNHLYAKAAHAAVRKHNIEARELADKIEDNELRTTVRRFVDFILLSKTLEKKDSEAALQLLQNSELPPLQRSWSYLELALIVQPSNQPEALAFIDHAITEAARISVSSPEAAQAWIGIARTTHNVNPTNSSQAVLDAIKALNKAPDYSGKENTISVRFRSKSDVAIVQIPTPITDLGTLFQTLAADDIFQATALAKTIIGESPRSVALLAAANSILKKKASKE